MTTDQLVPIPNREQVRHIFGKDVVGFVELAIMLGWRANFSGQTSITLIPFTGSARRIHLSSKNKNKGVLRNFVKTLIRHGDPAAYENLIAIADPQIPEDAQKLLAQLVMNMNEDKYAEAVTVSPKPEPAPQPTPKKPRKEARPKEEPVAIQTTVEKVEPIEIEPAKAERYVVSERPAMTHYSLKGEGNGISYPSQTTNERRWSDGTVDYTCQAKSCKKSSEIRRAFGGAHWAMHVRRGEAKPVDRKLVKETLVEDPTYVAPAWTRKSDTKAKQIADLVTMLQKVDLASITPEELAEMISDYLGDMGGGGAAGQRAPLTDAEVIDRIRTMVDRGTYAEQETAIREREREVAELQELLAEQERLVAEQEQKTLEATQSATKTEAQMNALFELVQELRKDMA